MLEPHDPEGDSVEPDLPGSRSGSVWPHMRVTPLDPAAPRLPPSGNWTDTARTIIDHLDARVDPGSGRVVSNPPEQLRAILCVPGAEVVQAAWDQDCVALFSQAGIDIACDAVLFACAGADLIDALADRPRAQALLRERDGNSADALAAYINRAALALLIGEVIGRFHYVIHWTRAQPAGAAPIILHVPGCYAAPDTAGGATGAWMRPAFAAAGVPEVMRRALITYVYDKLAAGLASLHNPAAGVHVLRWAGTTESVVPMVAQMLARSR